MKQGLLGLVLSAALLSWSGSVASAGRGGHGGGGGFGGGHSFAGGGSGFHGGSHGSYGGSGFHGGSHGSYGGSGFHRGGGWTDSGGRIHATGASSVSGRSGVTASGGNRSREFGTVGGGPVSGRYGTGHGNWARHNPANAHRFTGTTQNQLRNWQGRHANWSEAANHHRGHHNGHHGHDWWHNRCAAIILLGGGYWGWYDGWWYPAWGYDPYYSSYDYDGPIYEYDGLPPDEAIANVQAELQRLGYYSAGVDGRLGPITERALRRYQQDRGLPVTGAIDNHTVRSLRLG